MVNRTDIHKCWLNRSNFGIDLGDDVDELVEADGSISVLVSEINDLVDLSTGEVLSDAGGSLFEVLSSECSGVGVVKGLEDGLE